MALVYLSIAWVLGVFLGSIFSLPWAIIFIGILPLCLIPFLSHYKRQLLLSGFCLLSLFGGCLRFQMSLPAIDEHHLQFYNGKGAIEIEGMIATEPDPGNISSTFQFSASKLQTNGTYIEASGKALISVPRYQEYHYGDVLRITGKPETPPQY